MLHTYLLTEPVPEFADLDRELPVVRDDYVSGYLRQEQQSGLIGIYEQTGAEAVWHDTDGPDWTCGSWATCGPPAFSVRPSMIRRTSACGPRGRRQRA